MSMEDTGKTPPTIPHGLRREQLLELYYYMRLTRSLEERLEALKRQGKLAGSVFRSLGQEADAVGSAYALDQSAGDMMGPLIRNLGSVLVFGGTPLEVLRQTLSRKDSPTRGRDWGFSYGNPDRGFIPHIANLGNMVPVMAGVALKFKIDNERRVALVYSGDGATSTGAFHEGINFAAVQQLPLVVIVEHNQYAYSTPVRSQFAVRDLVEKAVAYGIPGEQADGNDVLTVYGVTKSAVDRARAGDGVTLIELKTYRRTGHAEHDDQRYVPAGEVESWEAKDPLDRYVAQLTEETDWARLEELREIDARVNREIDAATEQCLGEAMPVGESCLEGIYVDPPSSARLWFKETGR